MKDGMKSMKEMKFEMPKSTVELLDRFEHLAQSDELESLTISPTAGRVELQIPRVELQDIRRLPITIRPALLERLSVLFKALLTWPRRNQKSLTDDEKREFNTAVQRAIDDKIYEENFVQVHTRMALHRMHGMTGPIGALRFLPWHRVYLAKLEKVLSHYTANPHKFRIPYWDWANDKAVPSWIKTPAGVTRSPGTRGRLADQKEVDSLINNTHRYIPFTAAVKDLNGFDGLEQLHNDVHNWVGGTMELAISPRDPIFWLHHANIDRYWSRWITLNPGQLAPLAGPDRILDPYSDTIDDANDMTNYYYYYE